MPTKNPKPRDEVLRGPTKRLVSLVRRAAILRAQAVAKFDKRREIIKKAISAGLMVDQPIEVEIADKSAGIITKEKFVLVDNFEGEKTGGWATVNRFDLKDAPKNPRSKQSTGGTTSVSSTPGPEEVTA